LIGAPKGGERSDKSTVESGCLGSTSRTFENADENIPYTDQYYWKLFKDINPKSWYTGHRGWLDDNVKQWMPKLKDAVQQKPAEFRSIPISMPKLD
jgi:hypothetical protein